MFKMSVCSPALLGYHYRMFGIKVHVQCDKEGRLCAFVLSTPRLEVHTYNFLHDEAIQPLPGVRISGVLAPHLSSVRDPLQRQAAGKHCTAQTPVWYDRRCSRSPPDCFAPPLV